MNHTRPKFRSQKQKTFVTRSYTYVHYVKGHFHSVMYYYDVRSKMTRKLKKYDEIFFFSFQLNPSPGNLSAAGRAVGLKLADPSQNPSSSCPQLTVEEPTSTTSSIDDENGKASDQVSAVVSIVGLRHISIIS